MRVFNKPDLTAPRFRPKRLSILTEKFYKELKEEHPELKISYEKVKLLINTFNNKIWKEVVNTREGVELPEQLGYIFIGSCSRVKKDPVDYKKSEMLGFSVGNPNWESDNYLAKIFYTNFENKYRFKFHELWGFEATRDFKRYVAHTYPEEWKKYILVDNIIKVSSLFRYNRDMEVKAEKNALLLENYDEFDMD